MLQHAPGISKCLLNDLLRAWEPLTSCKLGPVECVLSGVAPIHCLVPFAELNMCKLDLVHE